MLLTGMRTYTSHHICFFLLLFICISPLCALCNWGGSHLVCVLHVECIILHISFMLNHIHLFIDSIILCYILWV